MFSFTGYFSFKSFEGSYWVFNILNRSCSSGGGVGRLIIIGRFDSRLLQSASSGKMLNPTFPLMHLSECVNVIVWVGEWKDAIKVPVHIKTQCIQHQCLSCMTDGEELEMLGSIVYSLFRCEGKVTRLALDFDALSTFELLIKNLYQCFIFSQSLFSNTSVCT